MNTIAKQQLGMYTLVQIFNHSQHGIENMATLVLPPHLYENSLIPSDSSFTMAKYSIETTINYQTASYKHPPLLCMIRGRNFTRKAVCGQTVGR